ncbi:MAG: T9SS type A sorting domain-containing protein [Bacteroidota bacterium]
MNKKTTILSLKCLLLLAFTQVLNAQQIYTNGPLSTGTTALGGGIAPAGYTWSEMQHETGNSTQTSASVGTAGWFTSPATTTSFLLADDFIVPVGSVWDVTSLEFFIYQTNTLVLPVDQLRVMIYSGVPGAVGTTLVAGSTTANVLDAANSGEAMMYRITDSQVPATVASPLTNRKIWKIRGNLTASLQAGTYWVVYQFHATSNTNAFSPHVTIPGTRIVPGANAKSKASTVAPWVNINDVGLPASAPGGEIPCALPFIVNGTAGVASVANDACSGALAAGTLPYTHTQTLGNLSTNNGGFLTGCTTAMNDGLWYSLVGDGTNVTVAVTGIDPAFDPQVDVYTGACGVFTGCVGSADLDVDGGDESVTFLSTLGTTYFINVGYMSETIDAPEGNFTIGITGVPMGNDTFANGNFRAYPNPVTDILNIAYTQEISSVAVYNLLGQEVIAKTTNASQSQVDMSQLAPGTYLVKVIADNQEQTIKVIKD